MLLAGLRARAHARDSKRIHLTPVSTPKKCTVGRTSAHCSRQATQRDNKAISTRWVLFPRAHEKTPQRLSWRASGREVPKVLRDYLKSSITI